MVSMVVGVCGGTRRRRDLASSYPPARRPPDGGKHSGSQRHTLSTTTMSLGSATSSTVPSEAPSTPHRRSASPASTITTADGDDIPVSASAAASPAAKDLAPPAPAAASPSSSPKSHQHHPERPSLPSLGGSGRRHRRASSTHRFVGPGVACETCLASSSRSENRTSAAPVACDARRD